MLNIGFQRKKNLLFTFLAMFFSFVGHGKSFGEKFRIKGLDGRRYTHVVEQDFHWNFWVIF